MSSFKSTEEINGKICCLKRKQKINKTIASIIPLKLIWFESNNFTKNTYTNVLNEEDSMNTFWEYFIVPKH